jgi:hypothetical protein
MAKGTGVSAEKVVKDIRRKTRRRFSGSYRWSQVAWACQPGQYLYGCSRRHRPSYPSRRSQTHGPSGEDLSRVPWK